MGQNNLMSMCYYNVIEVSKRKLEMTSYLNNSYDVMNSSAKFETFLPHRIITLSFMTVGSQMPELEGGGGGAKTPPHKLGSQNTPYKLGFISQVLIVAGLNCTNLSNPLKASPYVLFLLHLLEGIASNMI